MDIRPHVEALSARILSGDILGAFEVYYADDVIMSENGTDERVGKETNRSYEKAFVESLAEFHAGAAETVVIDGLNAATEWFFDYTTTEGQRMTYRQVALQTWNEQGQVIKEVFYHG